MNRLTDEQLMERAQGGDDRAFEVLYERTAKTALRVASAVCGRPDLAADAVQDAYLTMWRQRDRFDARSGRFRTWAMTVVHNRTIDLLRRERIRAAAPGGDELAASLADPRAAFADDTVERVGASAVRDCLAALPVPQREAVVLAFYGGMTHAEIASHLAVPLGTVKGRLRLALAAIRESLTPELAVA